VKKLLQADYVEYGCETEETKGTIADLLETTAYKQQAHRENKCRLVPQYLKC